MGKFDWLLKKPKQAPQELVDSSIACKYGEYACPKCGAYTDDRNFIDDDTYDGYTYVIDEVEYPLVFNERSGFDGEFDYSSWEEYHICSKCETKFNFTNGT